SLTRRRARLVRARRVGARVGRLVGGVTVARRGRGVTRGRGSVGAGVGGGGSGGCSRSRGRAVGGRCQEAGVTRRRGCEVGGRGGRTVQGEPAVLGGGRERHVRAGLAVGLGALGGLRLLSGIRCLGGLRVLGSGPLETIRLLLGAGCGRL